MANKRTSASSANTVASTNQELLIKSNIATVDVAMLGMNCIDQLRIMLKGIEAASIDNKVIQDLAKLSVSIADDFHNLLDVERENKQIIVDALVKE